MVTEAEKDEAYLKISGIPKDLYERWKRETNTGEKPASNLLNTALLESALRRDKAVNPNLDQYTFLTPEKREEIRLRHHQDPTPTPTTE